MEKRWTWMLLILIALVAFAGCSDDDDPVTPPPAASAFDTMVKAGSDYINNSGDCPGVLNAQDLNDDLASYTVIDIRQPGHFAEGHIPGAFNSSLGTLLDDLASKSIPSGKPYVVACYSGQSAGHAKIAMELMGYTDVYSLLFGMCSWSPSTSGSWENNTGDNLTNPETEPANGNLIVHDFPVLTGDANTIVATQVTAMLTAGFKGVMYDAIKDDLTDYFIINYFGEADYLGQGEAGVPGHIPGAFQFTPYASLGKDQMLNNLPTDKTIVVYCWTGQHSSQITAYLNMLGYDAVSLAFGSNNLFHTALTAHKWTSAQINDFELEVGAPATPAFSAMAAAGATYLNDSADCPGVLNAQDLNDDLASFTVIDIRQLGDYDAGNIDGAYHSSLGTLMDDLETTIPTDKPYVLACYSGQSAGHAKIAMELMGYDDVYSLLFGMSSWNAATAGSWNNNTGDTLTNPETTPNNGDLVMNAYPVLTEDEATVVEDRVDAMLAGGFKGVSYDAIKDNLEDYFVLNYFGEADYLGTGEAGTPGHIPGAFQFTPYASMGIDQMLGNIPADKTVVVYCWTGQHSSQVTAYLNMLGYDAVSLKFGSNNLFHTLLTAHKWSAAQINDFPLVATPALVAAY
jgi:rhodanese-related sulfurtransferase